MAERKITFIVTGRDNVTRVWKDVRKEGEKLENQLGDIEDTQKRMAKSKDGEKFGESTSKGFKKAGDAAETYQKSMGRVNEQTSKFTNIQQKATQAQNAATTSTKNQYNAITALNKAMTEGNTALKAYDANMRALTRSTSHSTSATNNQTSAFTKLTYSTNSAAKSVSNLNDLETKLSKAMDEKTKKSDEQTKSLDKLGKAASSTHRSLSSVHDAERRLASAMPRKTAETRRQGDAMDHLGHRSGFASKMLARLNGLLEQGRKAANDYDPFKQGFQHGLQFWQIATKLLMLMPLLGVAIGGVGGVVNGLVVGIMALGASVGRLTSLTGALVGLGAAAGVAKIGMKGIMETTFKPASTVTKDLAAATDALAAAQDKIAASREKLAGKAGSGGSGPSKNAMIGFQNSQNMARATLANPKASLASRQNAANTLRKTAPTGTKGSAGTPGATGAAASKANHAISAGEREVAALTLEIKRLKELEQAAKQFTAAKAQLNKDKIELWAGRGNEKANLDAAAAGMGALMATMKGVTTGFDGFQLLFRKILGDLTAMGNNPAFQKWANITVVKGTHSLSLMWGILKNLAPLLGKIVSISQDFTNKLLFGRLLWSQQYTSAEKQEKVLGTIQRWYDRGSTSLGKWADIWKNLVSGDGDGPGALANVFKALSKETDGLETSMVNVADHFQKFTSKNMPEMRTFFHSSMSVFKALGGLAVDISVAFGLMSGGGDVVKAGNTTASLVYFINQLGEGIKSLGSFAGESVEKIGPKLSRLFTDIGTLFGSTGGGSAFIKVVGYAIDLIDGLTKAAIMVEAAFAPAGKLVPYLMSFATIVGLVGAAAGKMVFPFVLLEKKLKWFTAVLKGASASGGIAGGLAAGKQNNLVTRGMNNPVLVMNPEPLRVFVTGGSLSTGGAPIGPNGRPTGPGGGLVLLGPNGKPISSPASPGGGPALLGPNGKPISSPAGPGGASKLGRFGKFAGGAARGNAAMAALMLAPTAYSIATEDGYSGKDKARQAGRAGTATSMALAGAAAGSFIPGVGTAVGAVIGGGIGYFGGDMVGKGIFGDPAEEKAKNAERKAAQAQMRNEYLALQEDKMQLVKERNDGADAWLAGLDLLKPKIANAAALELDLAGWTSGEAKSLVQARKVKQIRAATQKVYDWIAAHPLATDEQIRKQAEAGGLGKGGQNRIVKGHHSGTRAIGGKTYTQYSFLKDPNQQGNKTIREEKAAKAKADLESRTSRTNQVQIEGYDGKHRWDDKKTYDKYAKKMKAEGWDIPDPMSLTGKTRTLSSVSSKPYWHEPKAAPTKADMFGFGSTLGPAKPKDPRKSAAEMADLEKAAANKQKADTLVGNPGGYLKAMYSANQKIIEQIDTQTTDFEKHNPFVKDSKFMNSLGEGVANLEEKYGLVETQVVTSSKSLSRTIKKKGAEIAEQVTFVDKAVAQTTGTWAEAVNKRLASITSSAGAPAGSEPPKAKDHALGGVIAGDPRKGDVVPIMAAGGEVVLNESQQQLVGKARIGSALRKGRTPHHQSFAMGGKVHPTGPQVGEGNPFTSFESRFNLHRSSGDNEAPGVHAAGGYHYRKASWGGVQGYDYGDASNKPSDLTRAALALQANPKGVAEEFWFGTPNYIKHGAVLKGQGAAGHGDHLHVAFDSAGAGTGVGVAGEVISGTKPLPTIPSMGTSKMGKRASKKAKAIRDALKKSGVESTTEFTGDIPDMIRWAAQQYGAKPDGLLRVAKAESSLDPNAWNKTDINARNGIPSKGLFQFIESTFNSDRNAAIKANHPAWEGVSREWLDPKAQALAASWAFANGKGGAWATASQYGQGGEFTTNGPHRMIVGEKGPERVSVKPLREGQKEAPTGGGGTVVHVNVTVGNAVGKGGFDELAEIIGTRISHDLAKAGSAARRKGH